MTSSTAAAAVMAVMKVGAWNKGEGVTTPSGGGCEHVEQDEMFLFDEDLTTKPKQQQQQQQQQHQSTFRKACSSAASLVMHGLEYMTLEDRKRKHDDDYDEEDDDETLLSVSKTENNNFLHPRRFLHLQYGHSPGGDLASSADSELSASITIEGLRDHLQSCFTCGVLWRENQASLDCHECDGYALTRGCIDCNGSCGAIWTRDLTTSHQTHKAKFNGICNKLNLRNCSIGTESCESSTQLSDDNN